MVLKSFTFLSIVVVGVAAFLMSIFQLSAATRPLHDVTVYSTVVTLQSSLQKGTVPFSGNPCTGTPKKGGGICKTLEGKDFAGGMQRANLPPAEYPSTETPIGFRVEALADKSEDHKDHQIS